MVGNVAAHPDHQMLIVALVEKQQIAGARLIEILGHKHAVVLNQAHRGHKRAAAAIPAFPAIPQTLLFRGQVQFRRQIAVRDAVGLEPAVIMGPQSLIDCKPDQPGAILMHPARRRSLPELFADDPHEPGAKRRRLRFIQHGSGNGGKAAGQQQRQNQGAASADHRIGTQPVAPEGKSSA